MTAHTPGSPGHAWADNAVRLAEFIMRWFVNRSDVWGQYLPKAKRANGSAFTAPAKRMRGKLRLTAALLANHFRGLRSSHILGLHAISTEDTCAWGALDIDHHVGEASADRASENFGLAQRAIEYAASIGLRGIIEDSNGNGGYHVWFLLERPAPSTRVYAFARHWVAAAGLPEETETFPKQPSVRNGYGNWLRIPGRHHSNGDHWSRFWNGERWLEGTEAVEFLLNMPLCDPELLPPIPESASEMVALSPSDDSEAALRAVSRLKPERANEYDTWIAVGQALHAVDSGTQMLDAWIEWSRTSEKFKPGGCEEKWKDFRGDGGRSLRHLEVWANEDDPAGSDVPAPKGKKPPSEAADTFALIQASLIELWCSRDGQAFATISRRDHTEHLRVAQRGFRTWATDLVVRKRGRVPSASVLKNVIDTLESIALEQGARHDVAVRIARTGDAIYIDLGDETWEVIEITADGRRIIANPPIRFHRPSSLKFLPRPAEGGSLESLRRLGNFGDDDDNFVLFVAWILSALRARKPYLILIVEGEQGSAKSFTTQLGRTCVDPAAPPMRAQPRDERDLAIAALNTHVLAFDNLSRISAYISDALCRIATGSGFGTRRLYTDQEEIVFDHARPIVVNGITELATRSDLRDRAVVLDLPRITEECRRTEAEILEEIEAQLPAILGVLYSAVSMALRRYRDVRLTKAPRMADVATWMSACEESLGWAPGTFEAAYERNRRAAVVYAVEHDTVASAIRSLAQQHREWVGTPSDLLTALNEVADELVRFNPEWPKSPRQLSDRVRRAITDLREVSVFVACDRGDARRVTIVAGPDLPVYGPPPESPF
jgi:hypothetical protein